MPDTCSNKLYGRYQQIRNGFLPGHASTIAYLRACLNDRSLNASLRRALVRDVDQALREEETPHGAITDRVPTTTRPLLYSVRWTVPMPTLTDEDLKGGA
jgi:hypothetical protein